MPLTCDGSRLESVSAIGEHCAVRRPLSEADAENGDSGPGKITLDALQVAGADGGAGTGEQYGHWDGEIERLLLLPDQADGFDSLFGIQMRTLARNDDEVSAGYGVGDRHRGRTLEVDDYEVGFFGCALDCAENGIFGHIFDHGQRRGLAGTFCPARHGTVWIGIDDSDSLAGFGQLTC